MCKFKNDKTYTIIMKTIEKIVRISKSYQHIDNQTTNIIVQNTFWIMLGNTNKNC